MPFQKIQYKCANSVIFFYTGKVIDNSSAEITKIATKDCFINDFTNKLLNEKISGLEISIKTEEKVRGNSIVKIKESGRHNAQLLNLNKITFAELMKEECNIINSKDYEQLRKLKIENPKDLYLVLD
jgi:hypothetical protein